AMSFRSLRAGTLAASRRSVTPRCQAARPSPETMVMTSICGLSFCAMTVARLVDDTPEMTFTLIPVAFSKGSIMLSLKVLPHAPPHVAITSSCAEAAPAVTTTTAATSSPRHPSVHPRAMVSPPSSGLIPADGLGPSAADPDEAVEAHQPLDEQRDDRRHRDQHGRHRGDRRIKVPLHVLVDRHGQQPQIGAEQEDGNREIVERHDEREEAPREQAGADHGRRPPPPDLPRPRAQPHGRLV